MNDLEYCPKADKKMFSNGHRLTTLSKPYISIVLLYPTLSF